MYVRDLKAEFYEFLSGKRIYVMVHYDIDSICTCKILQTLFKFKNVLYSVVTVKGIQDLKQAFEENCKDVKYFVLINCGGTIDIIDVLEPEEDIIFFVLDSHRPTDLCNIYSNDQIRLLGNLDEDVQVPDFHDIFREDESEEEDEETEQDNDAESEGRAAKRRRLGEEEIMKRREKRLWEDKRNKLLFEYTQFTYYAKASAITMFELAWKVNIDSKDLLWLAIVALTEQMLMAKIDSTQYVLEAGNLQSQVTRLQNRSNDADVCTSLKITFEKDLRLTLYRHWTVEESFRCSPFTACKLKLWTFRGAEKFNELLADLGLPISQSKQLFFSMDLELRQEFRKDLEKHSDKYGLSDIIYASFTAQYGYRNKYCAADVVYILLAILENSFDKTSEECFHLALDCLSRKRNNLMASAIDSAKVMMTTLFKTVHRAMERKRIISAGPFVYYIVQEGCADWQMFSHQHVLLLLAHFLLRAYVTTSRNRRASSLPLIVSTPTSLKGEMCILLGIPPLGENSPKSLFGKAFEQAAEHANNDTTCDFFDTSYFQMHTKNRTRFFDALTNLLG